MDVEDSCTEPNPEAENVAGGTGAAGSGDAVVGDTTSDKPRKRKAPAPPVRSGDLRKLFASSGAARGGGEGVAWQPAPTCPAPATTSAPSPSVGNRSEFGVLGAFGLSPSPWQQLPETSLGKPPAQTMEKADLEEDITECRLETMVLSRPVELTGPQEAVPLLVASAPLSSSGRAIFAKLPSQWIGLTGRSDALGTRCLFASRRHEHSVFAPLEPGRLLHVPGLAHEWQPPLSIPLDVPKLAQLADEQPWAIEAHPGLGVLRVLVRPGVLLLQMLRRGTALPAARFTWRVAEGSMEAVAAEAHEVDSSGPLGMAERERPTLEEFSILSNLEDAAHTQPPGFLEFPLRREQLRSLGWMMLQERRRREPFVTELRGAAPCPDAPHWRIEGRLRCEYLDVKGGVLADAIGYGKTACTIGLVDCTASDPAPHVPASFQGFIPTHATLVLAPTNLHAQWLAEIRKFTGEKLKVLSVPTCAQLKKIRPRQIMEADIVVATYRLFYSTPYLQRLQVLARGQQPEFRFPKLPGRAGSHRGAFERLTSEWARAYRNAFEFLPAWAAGLPGRGSCEKDEPVTPSRPAKRRDCNADDITPEGQAGTVQEAGPGRRLCRKKEGSAATMKRRRTKQAVATLEESKEGEAAPATVPAVPASAAGQWPSCGTVALGESWPSWTEREEFLPLETFWWKRVVCDEFHELLSRYPPAQVAVELFHAEYKWGLSGTPPCQTLRQIRKAASFFGVQIPSPARDDGTDAEEPRQVAQEWLDAFVRRNTVELPDLEEEEQIVAVRLSPKEHALYVALTEQQSSVSVEAIEESPELQEARQGACGLLKLCSHFCPSGAADAITAEDECERQLALRQVQLRSVEREVRSLAERAASTVQLIRHFEPHFCCRPERSNVAYGFLARAKKPAIAARLKFLGLPAAGAKAEVLDRLFEALGKPDISEDVKEVALRVDFDPKVAGLAKNLPVASPPTWAGLEELALGQGSASGLEAPGSQLVARVVREAISKFSSEDGSVPKRCVTLRLHLNMPPAPGKAGEAEAGDRQALQEEWLAVEDNAAKLRNVIVAWKADVQRFSARVADLQSDAGSKVRNLQSFEETLQASQCALDEMPAEARPVPRFAKYGSKIEALVKHVIRLQSTDPTCKIICFVQWEDLKRRIGSALEEFDIDHLTLQGSVWSRRAALVKFQYEANSPRMLLLSLEESASGTNLTAANHVIIVHPMEAATPEEAVAFEMQAVGRVRRPGQERKIYIWRFVTVGTIEQKITEEHQRELWERQRAGILTSQPDLQPTSQAEPLDGDALSTDDESPSVLDAESENDDDDAATQPGDPQMEVMQAAPQDSSTQCYCDMAAEAPIGVPALARGSSCHGESTGEDLRSNLDESVLLSNLGAPEPAGGSLDDETLRYGQLGAFSAAGEGCSTQCLPDPDATQCY